MRICAVAAMLGAALGASPALAEFQMQTMRYLCERGVEVPATYFTADDGAGAVITVEGSQISLYSEPAASGARYGWPSDGSSYVWWTKGTEATLYWKDETGAEAPVLTDCKEKN